MYKQLITLNVFVGLMIFATASAQVDPVKFKAAFNRSVDEENAKNYPRSIQALKEVYDENSYECNARLGWLCYLNNNPDESIIYYRKAAKIRPTSTEALWGLATPLSMKQKWAELNDCYLAILKLDPKNSFANYYVGLYYFNEKNYVKAKVYFDVALDLYPMDSEIARMAGWTNYYLNKKQEAITLFNRVLLTNGTNKSALEGLALANKL